MKSSRFERNVVLLGSSGVGKTSIVTKYTSGIFDSMSSHATVGVSFTAQTFMVNNIMFTMNIWDTAGQERYKSLASIYFKDKDAIIIIFSLDAKSTFSDINEWHSELKKYYAKFPPILIVGNKADIEECSFEVDSKTAAKFAESIGANYLEVSAKTGQNIEKLFNDVASALINSSEVQDAEQHEKMIKLTDFSDENKQKCC
ncbi:Ras-related protein Rab-30 [Tritrichomonas foetus]|uniref:Ras-related protein Rab-30 n=1 Tax=Tritrichomonas foetus TaxID=1144522 RepID=A0A1J4KDC1_9EUKA|nr:Ras-related protein Rab-30 [Tritrichomonas foetus]|eukprot:OHT09439.1 Ras-related protein Rab-30 [Tritrichomonas foetus]